jgi:hypothetical protein
VKPVSSQARVALRAYDHTVIKFFVAQWGRCSGRQRIGPSMADDNVPPDPHLTGEATCADVCGAGSGL